jgi:hypothetical protein
MFDLDQFAVDCRAALAAEKSHRHVRDVVERAVADPASMLRALGEPKCAGLHTLYQSHDLTILNVVWADDDHHAPQPFNVGGRRHLYGTRG